MAYTLGPLHDLLSGSGTVTLSQPAGLLLTVLGYPIGVGVQPGTPTTLHRLGHITPGDPNGWHPKVQIIQTTQLVLPAPAGLTLCGYDLVYGAGLSIRELVGGPVPGSFAPYDRNPVDWRQYASVLAAGPTTPAVTAWTYTVPAGKILLVDALRTRCIRSTVATATGAIQTYISIGGVSVLNGPMLSNTLSEVKETQNGAQISLLAGQTIAAVYRNTDTGGAVGIELFAHGVLFDA